MSKNKKIAMYLVIFIIAILTIGSIAINNNQENIDNDKLKIVATTFSTYDFSRQIVGEDANVTYLLGPGVDSHSYEPSASDLIKIKNADVFIYVGGEMEKWVDKVLESDVVDTTKTKLICVTDCVETIDEIEVDGAEEDTEEDEKEGAFDEHIWTSLDNAEEMVSYLAKLFSELDPAYTDDYITNSESYIYQIRDVKDKIQEVMDNKKRDILIFGDKMPMQYFINEFNLRVSAAFSGCSTETEPSAKTIAYLVQKVKEENVPVVLYIELSSGKTAISIANETGTKAMQIQTLHNVSKTDFENKETYVSLMTRNIEVLKEALQ